jgi:hypothetical protein
MCCVLVFGWSDGQRRRSEEEAEEEPEGCDEGCVARGPRGELVRRSRGQVGECVVVRQCVRPLLDRSNGMMKVFTATKKRSMPLPWQLKSANATTAIPPQGNSRLW